MLMSTPAITDRRVASFSVGAARCTVTTFLMSSQSETATPSKPSSPRSTSVSSHLLKWPGTPLISPEFTITERAPAFTAAANGGSRYSRSVISGTSAGVRSCPVVGTL